MTLEILGRANGLEFRDLSHRGMRAGCHCIESRDIGAYDTCINGCRYCYANTDDRLALENYKRHDPDSPAAAGADQAAGSDLHGFAKVVPASEIAVIIQNCCI